MLPGGKKAALFLGSQGAKAVEPKQMCRPGNGDTVEYYGLFPHKIIHGLIHRGASGYHQKVAPITMLLRVSGVLNKHAELFFSDIFFIEID